MPSVAKCKDETANRHQGRWEGHRSPKGSKTEIFKARVAMHNTSSVQALIRRNSKLFIISCALFSLSNFNFFFIK